MTMRNLAAIDLNLLVAFDALLAERNVTRAGERIGLSQSATSKALNRLRQMFGDPLLVRQGGEMLPTARALELAAPLRRALAEISLVMGAGDGPFLPATVQASMTLASPDLVDCVLLPPLVPRLRREAPGLDLRVRVTDRLRFQGQLIGGEADLAVVPAGEIVTELRREPLYVERMVMLAAAGNPAVAGGEVDLETYLACDHVVVSPEGRGGSPTDAVLAARGLRRRIALVLPSFAAVPLVVGAGNLVATLPEKLVRRLAPAAGIKILRPPLQLDDVTMHMVWHQRHDADPLHRWMRGVIREVGAAL
ncbi:LysR family transcriptional regulator [Arenibaculum sp.]|uniref:LysR family transcriptional regulator n=1 Tax=Arenibaculum sp. TaxID=2865862 RepID=UPI002E10A475|nr:LysR family transcriptional regulator [Arenibaculum sp.]